MQQAYDAIRRRLAARSAEAGRDLREPNLEALRAFVCLLDECVESLNEAAGLAEQPGMFLRSSVLQACFTSLAWYRRGDGSRAADWLIRSWISHALAFGQISQGGSPEPGGAMALDAAEQEFLATYNLAISELLATRLRDAQARLILRRLMAHLGLSLDHLGRMLNATGDTVRLWEQGKAEVPHSHMGELLLADKALNRLLELFRSDRLPLVIRRKADLFDKERALEWILRGRIADVADRYDTALAYQT